MSRIHLIQSWVGCREPEYSGEQIGDRRLPSKGITLQRHYDVTQWEDIPTHINGKACISNFSDEGMQRWLNPEASQGKKVERIPLCILPGQEEIERLDQQQLAMFERFKLGELSKCIYDSIISDLRAKQQKAWDIHIEASICNPLDGKASEKEKTQEKLYMLATIVIMIVGWIAYHGIK